MRKRNISFVADKLLWFIILILPLLFALVFTCASMNNYQLQVDSSSLDGYDSVRVDFDDTFNGTPLLSYNNNTNIVNGLIYMPLITDIRDDDFKICLFDDINYSYSLEIVHNSQYEPYYLYNEDYGNLFVYIGINNGLDTWQIAEDFYSFVGDNLDNIIVNGVVYGGISFGFVTYLDLDYFYVDYYSTFVLPSNDNIFKTYFNNLNYSLDSWFTFGERDIVYNAFNSIFGSQSNIMPIFVEGSFIPKYLTYLAWIYVLHLAFDFLVFIPRLAHKWMGGVYKDEDS